MKKQTKKYKYFQTLFDSVKIIFKNPRFLIPYMVMFLLMIVFTFATDLLGNTLRFSLINGQNIVLLIMSYLIMIVFFVLISLVIAGWSLSVLNQYMHTNKFNLKSAFKRSFSFAGRFFLISLILVLVLVLAYFAVYALSFVSSHIGMPLLSLVIGIIFLVLVVIYMTVFVQLTPVLVIEDKGTLETIRKTIDFYLKKKLYSLNIFLVAMLFGCILALPSIIYMMYIMFTQISMFGVISTIEYTTTQKIILDILQLPIYIGSAATALYYCISYKIKKATIKEK